MIKAKVNLHLPIQFELIGYRFGLTMETGIGPIEELLSFRIRKKVSIPLIGERNEKNWRYECCHCLINSLHERTRKINVLFSLTVDDDLT